MVRVPHGLLRDVPCRLPVHAVLIKEDADQLGDRKRGVCVVELDRVPLVEARNVGRRLQVDTDHVLQRATHEEVMLLKPQLFALESGLVRVEHFADRLGGDFLLDRTIVVTNVERLEIEGIDSLRAPQAQQICRVDLVSEHRGIVRDASDHARRNPANATAALLVGVLLRAPPETNVDCDFGARDLPRIAEAKPLVRDLHLPAIADLLVEDAELVPNTVTDRGDLKRCERIEVAGRKPAEAAGAEARLFFLVEEDLEIETELLHGLLRRIEGPELEEIVAEVWA